MAHSYLGLTYNNYGKKYGVISTNLSGPEILADENLVENSLIISSPTVGPLHNAEDNVGYQTSHAMFFTDYKGIATRLTYTILPGNGLVVNAYWNDNGTTALSDTNHPYTPDTLTFEIDKDSLKTISSNGQLQVSKPDIIDNYTLMVTQQMGSTHSYISVITANLEKATDIKYGIVRGDNTTISANNGIISVNTCNLDYVDDTTNTPGIVRPNPDLEEGIYDWRTIEANNGVLRVLTYNLDRATTDVVGVVKPEGVTTLTDANGTISVRTAGLEKAGETGALSYGIVRPDNYTLEFLKNGEENMPGVLYANSRNMTPTSFDENGNPQFGVVKLDSYSFGIDNSKTTYVNRYPEVVAILDRYLVDYTYIINWLIDHENRITALEHQNVEMIASFNNYGTTITTLDMPVWDPDAHVVHSEEKFYSVQFSIVTNCKFHVSVEYQNNVSPGITLHRVKMGDNPPVSGSGLSNYMFESTNMNENTLNFEFLCNNYEASSLERSTPTTVFITVSSINDASVYRSGAHVFNRWNMTTFIEPDVPEPVYTEHECIEYQYVPDGEQNKDLYFRIDNGTEYNVTKSVEMTSANKMTSSSFYIVAEEKLRKQEIKYKEIYKDGVFLETTPKEISDVTGPEGLVTNYFTLSLNNQDTSRTSYSLIATPNIFHRDAIINNDDYGWEPDQLDETNRVWFSYHMTNIASNTLASVSRQGVNTLEIMSTKPISTNDRKLSLQLNLNSKDSDDYSSWKNTELTINYIEDIIATDMSASVTSTIPSVTRTSLNGSINEVILLQLNVSRTNNVTLNGEEWGVDIQYCFNTIDGTVRKNSFGTNTDGNKATEPLTTNDLNYLDSVSTRTNQNQTDTTGVTLSGMTSAFNKIRIKMPPTMSETTVSVKLVNTGSSDNASWVPQIQKENGVNLVYYERANGADTEVTTVIPSMLVPQSVINYMTNQVSSEQTEIENIISGFKIVNCILYGDDFPTFVSETSRINANISWESYGMWPTHTIQQNNQLSFGNAFINNITINRWDDSIMEYEFKIIGGDTTNIPYGAQIETLIPYGNIKPTIIMHYGSNSFVWNDYYDHIIISNDNGWLGTSTKVKVRLCNIPPVAPDPNISSWQLYAETEQQQQVYDRGYGFTNDSRFAYTSTQMYLNGDGERGTGMCQTNVLNSSPMKNEGIKGTDNQSLSQHKQVSSNHPMIEYIDGLRFNFVLVARYNDQFTTMNFAADLGQCTEKITFANPVNYNTGVSKDYTVVNAFYNNSSHNYGINSSSSSTVVRDEKQTYDTITYLVDKIEQMQNTINELTNGNDAGDDNGVTTQQSGKTNTSSSVTTR